MQTFEGYASSTNEHGGRTQVHSLGTATASVRYAYVARRVPYSS
jgi:hypothetical protein